MAYQKEGIDISYCQPKVDWSKVNIDFCIIKAGQRNYTDNMYESHYKNVTEKGLDVGAYWFLDKSSLTIAAAEQEAQEFIKRLKGKKFSYPVFLDIEYNEHYDLGKKQASAMIRAFLKKVENAGYWVGLYTNLSWLNNRIDDDIKNRYTIWLAQWANKPTYNGAFGLWQTGTAIISGFPDPVDHDWCYVDYPTKIKEKGLNGYNKPDPAPAPQLLPYPEGFTPRLSLPEKGNKYYNTVSNGGYSTCIVGQPTQDGLNTLSNCFTGDTKIITRDGLVRLDSIVGKEVMVLSKGGKYRKAIGGYYGKQPIYKVKLGNGDEFRCSGNHRWYVGHYVGSTKTGRNLVFDFVDTINLKKWHYVPYQFISDEEYDVDGIRNGFIYGDGSIYNKNQSCAYLCGKKKEFMFDYFKDSKHISTDSRGILSAYPYPLEYKKIPETSKSLSYLRGFLKGLFASDGCVDKYGCVSISTTKMQDAEKISEIGKMLGYRNNIYNETRDTNFKKNSTIYLIRFMQSSLPLSMFINPEQIQRLDKKNKKHIKHTKVKSVEELGLMEDVFCVSEPETNTMTLDGNILTGQCVGWAIDRFNEIVGENKFVYLNYPPNGEDVYARAIKDGLEVSQEPSYGAIICFAKGKTGYSADGAGHVGIVEQMYDDGTIVTSESGYKSSTPFWTTKRNNSDGQWGSAGKYTFLGFVKNPKLYPKPEPTPTPVDPCPYKEPTKAVKEGAAGEDVKWVQWYLTQLKYFDNTIDGIFEIMTLGAVLAFQFKNGLDVDGSCGPATRKALKVAYANM